MDLDLPKGFQFAGISCSIKKKANTKDITLIVSDVPAVVAGVYTQNQVVAAPVTLCREKTPSQTARAIIVNSGNANACTGAQGDADARKMCSLVAEACGGQFSGKDTFVMSTGVIGRFLPMDKIQTGIANAAAALSSSEQSFLDAADGILTTDNGRKVMTRTCRFGERSIRIAGMAKGAGMIGPNMATMLCCVLTDAKLEPEQAQRILQSVADRSFNNISVEGHTSTNDSMLLMANGQAGGEVLSGEEEAAFVQELTEACIELAKLIPADGEGAGHLIEVVVSGAKTDQEARRISHTVASSNLVKTAVFGNDPNWGRIVSAAGYADAEVNVHCLQLKVNGILLFDAGEPVAFDAKEASHSMRDNATTRIELCVGTGAGTCTHWSSDLSVEYVRFNSEYTT